MINYLYALHDLKTTYMAPMMAKTDDEAIRSITHAYREGNTMLSKFPADFRLYCLGEYNVETGKITADSRNPLLILDCASLSVTKNDK